VIALVLIRQNGGHKPQPEAVRRYQQGLTALREGSYLTASRFLEQAVQLDSNYIVASASLASAWNELDFSGKAKDRILSLPSASTSLPQSDQLYVAAIRDTISQNFDAAAATYTALLKKLPPEQRAYTLFTRGLVYEKRGEIKRARDDYSAAAAAYHAAASSSSAHEYAVAFLHRGILETRQQSTSAAEKDFTTAENAYRDAGNFEGLAEVNFQRGFAAEVQGKWKEAADYLHKSIDAVHDDIASVQLEVRARSHLITIAANSEDPAKALAEAQETVTLARRKGVEYWAVDASIREADVYLMQQNYAQAEEILNEAFETAERNGWPRLSALANLALASSRDQQNKPAEDVLRFANAAREYYQRAGFLSESVRVGVLIGRVQLNSADYRDALDSGNQALHAAGAVGNPLLVNIAEELLGTVELKLENYPAALTHMQAALDLSKAGHSPPENQMLYIADILWRTGHYQEAEKTLAAIPPAAIKHLDLSLAANRILADMRLSQGKYKQVLQSLQKEASADPDDLQQTSTPLKMDAGQAAARLHMQQQAVTLCQQALDNARKSSDTDATAHAELALASVDLSQNNPTDAKRLAEEALQFFKNANQIDSEWRTLALLSGICRQALNCAPDAKYEQKAIDKLAEMKQTWQPTVYGAYTSRPDIQATLASLRK
jgi:tetratricopeptide (TPR) repeat protein